MNALLLEPLSNMLSDNVDLTTALDQGWDDFDNGELLSNVQKNFEVFLTGDTNLSDQQDLSRYNLGFVIFSGESNRIDDLLPLVDDLVTAIQDCTTHQLIRVKPDEIHSKKIG